MKDENSTRLDVLRSLLTMSAPFAETVKQLARFNFDYEGDAVELTSAHLSHVLRRYLDGQLLGSDVEAWANAIEGRDDVSISGDSKSSIESVLHELANPYLTCQLDSGRANYLLRMLNSAPRTS